MASRLIQFRLSDEELQALQASSVEGESLNLTAQRLLKQLLGTTKPLLPADVREETRRLASDLERLQGTVASLQKVVDSLYAEIEELKQPLKQDRTRVLASFSS